MSFFLVQYDRGARQLLSLEEFTAADREKAYLKRRQVESAAVHNIEVVVLEANSASDLHKTHSRYFYSLEELRDRA